MENVQDEKYEKVPAGRMMAGGDVRGGEWERETGETGREHKHTHTHTLKCSSSVTGLRLGLF